MLPDSLFKLLYVIILLINLPISADDLLEWDHTLTYWSCWAWHTGLRSRHCLPSGIIFMDTGSFLNNGSNRFRNLESLFNLACAIVVMWLMQTQSLSTEKLTTTKLALQLSMVWRLAGTMLFMCNYDISLDADRNVRWCKFNMNVNIGGLVQERQNSNVLTMELRLSCKDAGHRWY